jgi:hypothetical protein
MDSEKDCSRERRDMATSVRGKSALQTLSDAKLTKCAGLSRIFDDPRMVIKLELPNLPIGGLLV